MAIRKRPELDVVNPPGQIVWPFPSSAHSYKPVHGGYPDAHVSEAKEDNSEDDSILQLADYFRGGQIE